MRQRFDVQKELGQTPIERVAIPANSRDELPPVLKGLQWIFCTPAVNEAIFALLEEHVVGDVDPNTGRPGMDLWHILVLGTIRLALDCDYDRLEYIAANDRLVRQLMGLPVMGYSEETSEGFHHRTISDNVCQFDEALLTKINLIVAQHAQPLFKKNGDEPLHIKTDSYVLETNVHFPTDTNLLWDALRKSSTLVARLCEAHDIDGWRKHADWQRRIKGSQRQLAKTASQGGPNKEKRVEAAAKSYLKLAYDAEKKINESVEILRGKALSQSHMAQLTEVVRYQDHVIRHIDFVERRLLRGESVPHAEKYFSLFEEHTELIKKGKVRPPIELGHRVLISTEQHGLILDYKIMGSGGEPAEVVPTADRLIHHFGKEGVIASMSFDKGFSNAEDRELLELYIPQVIMPKKGKKTAEEQAKENEKTWKRLRHAHSAVESNINSLEHHGLNRCPDKGWRGYQRYVGLGILAYNLHKIGAKLLSQETETRARKAKQPRPAAADAKKTRAPQVMDRAA